MSDTLVQFLVTQGLTLILKARQVWVAKGFSPDEFDWQVGQQRAARAAAIAGQQADELTILGGG